MSWGLLEFITLRELLDSGVLGSRIVREAELIFEAVEK